MSLQKTFFMLLTQTEGGTRTFIIPSEVSYEANGEFAYPVDFAGLDPKENSTVYKEYEEEKQALESYSYWSSITLTLPSNLVPINRTITSAKFYYRIKLSGDFSSLPIKLTIGGQSLVSRNLNSIQLAGNLKSVTLDTSVCTTELLNGGSLELYIGSPNYSISSAGSYNIKIYGFKLVLEFE